MKFIQWIFFWVLMSSVTSAQIAPFDPEMDDLIAKIEATPFIQGYKIYQNQMEAQVKLTKLEVTAKQKEVEKCRIAYGQCQQKSDAIWDEIKQDLVNPATQKRIKSDPNEFAKRYQAKFDAVRSYTDTSFTEPSNRVRTFVSGEKLGFWGEMIAKLVDFFKTWTVKQETTKNNQLLYLETKLIERLRFKSWEKLI